jgi:hypothetical protein
MTPLIFCGLPGAAVTTTVLSPALIVDSKSETDPES